MFGERGEKSLHQKRSRHFSRVPLHFLLATLKVELFQSHVCKPIYVENLLHLQTSTFLFGFQRTSSGQ